MTDGSRIILLADIEQLVERIEAQARPTSTSEILPGDWVRTAEDGNVYDGGHVISAKGEFVKISFGSQQTARQDRGGIGYRNTGSVLEVWREFSAVERSEFTFQKKQVQVTAIITEWRQLEWIPG